MKAADVEPPPIYYQPPSSSAKITPAVYLGKIHGSRGLLFICSDCAVSQVYCVCVGRMLLLLPHSDKNTHL